MIDERFDAIVIGAGMAGNAAALTMAKRGLKVLQIERGEYAGSKNVQGAILYSDMLEKLIPDFREDAPLESVLGNDALRRLGALIAIDEDGRLSGVVTVDAVGRALRPPPVGPSTP